MRTRIRLMPRSAPRGGEESGRRWSCPLPAEAARLDIDGEPAHLAELGRLELEGRDQPQLVEGARTEAPGEPADLVEGAQRDAPEVGDLLARRGGGGQGVLEGAESDEE